MNLLFRHLLKTVRKAIIQEVYYCNGGFAVGERHEA